MKMISISLMTSTLSTLMSTEERSGLIFDRIPVVRTKKGELVQDWDTVGAIDVDFLSSALAYVREHGTLPPRLRSKEDQNEAKDPGVAKDIIESITQEVKEKLSQASLLKDEGNGKVTIAFLEGFLLFAPPETENPGHVLRHVHDNIHLHIFLSAPYDTVKSRREARSGYVTIGPAPTPAAERENKNNNDGGNEHKGPSPAPAVDLEEEDKSEPQNFWTDPPGYVDDIVWPRYVQDHAWLLVAEDDEAGRQSLADRHAAGSTQTEEELLRLAGQAVNVRSDAGVVVAPGKGKKPMSEVLRWAVDEILQYLKV
jgi:nicotinamide/nicotinate riboside kinase